MPVDMNLVVDLANKYRPAIRSQFGTDIYSVNEGREGKSNGRIIFTAIKGNWSPFSGVDKVKLRTGDDLKLRPEDQLELRLQDRVLHERVIAFSGTIPIRSHEETDHELVRNIGDCDVTFYIPEGSEGKILRDYTIYEREFIETVNSEFCPEFYEGRGHGFFHGFSVSPGETGILYIAKALKPEFVNGNSFKVPRNTYRGKQI